MCIVVLDNDECTGSWAGMSVLYSIMDRLGIPPNPALFARLIVDTGAIRPGVRALFDVIQRLRQNGGVSRVVMCTAARNDNGWVMFLRRVLEIWYGSPFFDVVIDGKAIRDWHTRHGTLFDDPVTGSVYKDMNMVRFRFPDEQVIMVDDRPNYIQNGTALGVTPFGKQINLTALAREYIPVWNADIERMLERDLNCNVYYPRTVNQSTRTEEQWVSEMYVLAARLYLLATTSK